MKLFKLVLMAALPALMAVSCGKQKSTDTDNPVGKEVNDTARTTAPAYKVVDGTVRSAAGLPMVVDFYADWCPPCRQMKPLFDSFAEKYRGRIDFVSINVDDNPTLASAYKVESIPCFVFISSDGREVGRAVGMQDSNGFEAAVASYFPIQAGE